MINDDFAPPSIPYNDSPSEYQQREESARTQRRISTLEDQVAELKKELERKNTRAVDVGRPVPYVLRGRS